MHVCFDGLIIDRSISAGDIYDWLLKAPEEVGMQRISLPTVSGDPLAGIVLLAESHIAVHIENNVALIDIFTCRTIDVVKATALVQELPIEIKRTLVLERGLEYLR